MATKTLKDLFRDQLQDVYSAEKQLTKALPQMAKAAKSDELRAGLERHLEETKNQLSRLEQVCEQVGCKTGPHTCPAMEGLIQEGEKIIGLGLDEDARDAGLIAAAQKVEHYEIASYGSLCAFAKQLGHEDVAHLLHETLEEEKRADETLTRLAKQGINQAATA